MSDWSGLDTERWIRTKWYTVTVWVHTATTYLFFWQDITGRTLKNVIMETYE